MKNNKGFTLVEIIGAVTILGIISTIGVVAATKYIEKAKMNSYKHMENALYTAANNYIIDKGILVRNPLVITSDKLISEDLLEPMQDPGTKGSTKCSGTVTVRRINRTGTDIDEYEYTVELTCSDYSNTLVIKD